jgi:hypothetical protein
LDHDRRLCHPHFIDHYRQKITKEFAGLIAIKRHLVADVLAFGWFGTPILRRLRFSVGTSNSFEGQSVSRARDCW